MDTMDEWRAWAVEMAVESGAPPCEVVHFAELILEFVLGVEVTPDASDQR